MVFFFSSGASRGTYKLPPRMHCASCGGFLPVVGVGAALPLEKPQRSVCFHLNKMSFCILLSQYVCNVKVNKLKS